MTLPTNVRSLFACGAFCVVGGAWLALVTEVRTSPLRNVTNAAFADPPLASDPPCLHAMMVQNAEIENERIESTAELVK
jgi:hypothetical protein